MASQAPSAPPMTHSGTVFYHFRPVILSFELGNEVLKTMTLKEYPLNTIARIVHYNHPFIAFATQRVLYHRCVPGRTTTLLWGDYRVNIYIVRPDGIVNLNDTHWNEHVDMHIADPLFIHIKITNTPYSHQQELELRTKQASMYPTLANDKTSLEAMFEYYAANPKGDPPVIVDVQGKYSQAPNNCLATTLIAPPQLFYYPIQGANTVSRRYHGIPHPIPMSVYGTLGSPSLCNERNLPNLQLDENLNLFFPKMSLVPGMKPRNKDFQEYIHETGYPNPRPAPLTRPPTPTPSMELVNGSPLRDLHNRLIRSRLEAAADATTPVRTTEYPTHRERLMNKMDPRRYPVQPPMGRAQRLLSASRRTLQLPPGDNKFMLRKFLLSSPENPGQMEDVEVTPPTQIGLLNIANNLCPTPTPPAATRSMQVSPMKEPSSPTSTTSRPSTPSTQPPFSPTIRRSKPRSLPSPTAMLQSTSTPASPSLLEQPMNPSPLYRTQRMDPLNISQTYQEIEQIIQEMDQLKDELEARETMNPSRQLDPQ